MKLQSICNLTTLATSAITSVAHKMPFVYTKDHTQIYYKDWGNPAGQPVVFSHGWPLNSDNWENQMFFLASKGYRVIAHDRRGHGRSSQPWEGNNMDTYADDLLVLFEHLHLKNVMVCLNFAKVRSFSRSKFHCVCFSKSSKERVNIFNRWLVTQLVAVKSSDSWAVTVAAEFQKPFS